MLPMLLVTFFRIAAESFWQRKDKSYIRKQNVSIKQSHMLKISIPISIWSIEYIKTRLLSYEIVIILIQIISIIFHKNHLIFNKITFFNLL